MKKSGEGNTYVGIGFDVHRFIAKRKLILAGIEIPFEYGLDAVSDGDVVLHALSDAILGAAALGDIGDYFPPQEEQSKGVSSKRILAGVLDKIEGCYTIGNVDITIIAEKPRLVQYKEPMTKSLCALMDVTRVGIKIKSKEGLCIFGGGDSIACFAAISLSSCGGD